MLRINHTAGFFSCCSIKLWEIVKYINQHKKLPDTIDGQSLFSWYKTQENYHKDITYDYFQRESDIDDNVQPMYEKNILYDHDDQFIDYATIDFPSIQPLIQRYFSPSQHILEMIQTMEEKYGLVTSVKRNYDNICVLFYRGNDKMRETKICEYKDVFIKARSILEANPTIQFLIQSDETEFIQAAITEFPDNSFYFQDEIRHIPKCNDTVDKVYRSSNHIFSMFYLAITIVMSRCKYIIYGSLGNCSIWIMFYRNGVEGTYSLGTPKNH